MDKSEIRQVMAAIAASYARRELDRTVYDRLLASAAGKKLKSMPKSSKYALEFLSYSLTAMATRNQANSSFIKKFIKDISFDAPSEIAKRVINGVPKIDPKELNDLIGEVSDEELDSIISAIRVRAAEESLPELREPDRRSTLATWTHQIEQKRRVIQRKRRGK